MPLGLPRVHFLCRVVASLQVAKFRIGNKPFFFLSRHSTVLNGGTESSKVNK